MGFVYPFECLQRISFGKARLSFVIAADKIPGVDREVGGRLRDRELRPFFFGGGNIKHRIAGPHPHIQLSRKISHSNQS